jgi:hypothetical protein
MSTTELERRLADVLQRHAEDAMSRTNTDGQLAELLEETRTEDKRRRNHRVFGALVAAAAVAALTFWVAARDTDRAEPEPVGPISPEQVATEYLHALAAYDVPRAEAYLSAEPELRKWDGVVVDLDGWRAAQLWNQAAGFEMDPGACQTESAIQPGATRLRCPYVFRSLGSEELGLGPYSGSSYVITVQNGAIISASDVFEYVSNGYNVEVWEPFAAWVADNYPQDFRVMYDNDNQVTTEESDALWHEHLFGYVAAKLAEQ